VRAARDGDQSRRAHRWEVISVLLAIASRLEVRGRVMMRWCCSPRAPCAASRAGLPRL